MYTDSDILDLYDHLQDIGLAETPYEEAERLRIEAREEYRQSRTPNRRAPRLDMVKWILDRNIPHTYALTVWETPYVNGMITTLFPVVRGYVLYTNDTLTLAGFESIRSIHSFHYFSTLKGLKQGLLDLGKIHPTINPDKYSFLDIV